MTLQINLKKLQNKLQAIDIKGIKKLNPQTDIPHINSFTSTKKIDLPWLIYNHSKQKKIYKGTKQNYYSKKHPPQVKQLYIPIINSSLHKIDQLFTERLENYNLLPHQKSTIDQQLFKNDRGLSINTKKKKKKTIKSDNLPPEQYNRFLKSIKFKEARLNRLNQKKIDEFKTVQQKPLKSIPAITITRKMFHNHDDKFNIMNGRKQNEYNELNQMERNNKISLDLYGHKKLQQIRQKKSFSQIKRENIFNGYNQDQQIDQFKILKIQRTLYATRYIESPHIQCDQKKAKNILKNGQNIQNRRYMQKYSINQKNRKDIVFTPWRKNQDQQIAEDLSYFTIKKS